MPAWALALLVQLCLAFGMAGLLWPERLKPVFELLMFPWMPSYNTLRVHSLGAIVFSALLFLIWLVRIHGPALLQQVLNQGKWDIF